MKQVTREHPPMWVDGVFIVDLTACGSVSDGASGDWFAYGCRDEWEDVPLGSFATEREAKARVVGWFRDALRSIESPNSEDERGKQND